LPNYPPFKLLPHHAEVSTDISHDFGRLANTHGTQKVRHHVLPRTMACFYPQLMLVAESPKPLRAASYFRYGNKHQMNRPSNRSKQKV
jgi:hypothetical protein